MDPYTESIPRALTVIELLIAGLLDKLKTATDTNAGTGTDVDCEWDPVADKCRILEIRGHMDTVRVGLQKAFGALVSHSTVGVDVDFATSIVESASSGVQKQLIGDPDNEVFHADGLRLCTSLQMGLNVVLPRIGVSVDRDDIDIDTDDILDTDTDEYGDVCDYSERIPASARSVKFLKSMPARFVVVVDDRGDIPEGHLSLSEFIEGADNADDPQPTSSSLVEFMKWKNRMDQRPSYFRRTEFFREAVSRAFENTNADRRYLVLGVPSDTGRVQLRKVEGASLRALWFSTCKGPRAFLDSTNGEALVVRDHFLYCMSRGTDPFSEALRCALRCMLPWRAEIDDDDLDPSFSWSSLASFRRAPQSVQEESKKTPKRSPEQRDVLVSKRPKKSIPIKRGDDFEGARRVVLEKLELIIKARSYTEMKKLCNAVQPYDTIPPVAYAPDVLVDFEDCIMGAKERGPQFAASFVSCIRSLGVLQTIDYTPRGGRGRVGNGGRDIFTNRRVFIFCSIPPQPRSPIEFIRGWSVDRLRRLSDTIKTFSGPDVSPGSVVASGPLVAPAPAAVVASGPLVAPAPVAVVAPGPIVASGSRDSKYHKQMLLLKKQLLKKQYT